MKKMWKYIAGFFTILGGILIAFFSGKDAGRSKEKEQSNVKKSLESKKKALEEIKKQKNKKVKDVSADDAADFLKKYAKKK